MWFVACEIPLVMSNLRPKINSGEGNQMIFAPLVIDRIKQIQKWAYQHFLANQSQALASGRITQGVDNTGYPIVTTGRLALREFYPSKMEDSVHRAQP